VTKTLLERGAGVAACGGRYITPLNAAAFVDSLSVARLLIQRKAEVDIMDSSGKHALHHSSARGNEELVRLLLQSDADIETQDSAGGNAMHIACFSGHISTIGVLVEYNAEIDARARFTADGLEPGSPMEARLAIGRTPLMEAAWGGQEEVVDLLLDLGADINAVDDLGMTSLIRAARRGHEKVVKILLTRGANAMVKDKKGWTADNWLSAK